MEWIETYNHETVDWKEYALLLNGFIIVKMIVIEGKVHLFSESPKKYNDREFNFMRLFLGREDVDAVKDEIMNLFKN